MGIKAWAGGKLVERLASPSGAAGIVSLTLIALGTQVSPEMQSHITDVVAVIAATWLCWVKEHKDAQAATTTDQNARDAGLGS